MSAAELRLRSQILGTQTIARDTAMRLGVVNQVWVNLEQKQVLALDVLRGQVFGGDVIGLEFGRVGAFGRDAILVENEDVFDNLDPDELSRVIGSTVVTETGVTLGRIRDYAFDPETGEIAYFILSNLGIPYLPGILDSTYEMAAADIINGGGDRLIVAEATETRLTVLKKSFLETTFGIGKPPWMVDELPTLPSAAVDLDDDEEYYEDEYAEEYEEEDADEPEYGESVYAEEAEPEPEDEPAEEEPVEEDYVPDDDPKDEYEEAAEAMEADSELEEDDDASDEPEAEPFEPPVDLKEEEEELAE